MSNVVYKDISQLTQKSSVAGTEKLPVSATEYITPNQIVSGKEDATNKVTTVDNTVTNSQYFAAKPLFDALFKWGVVSQTITWTGDSTNGWEASTSSPVMGIIPQYFIELVTKEGAAFDATTGYFELNGITDIAYDEMREIYSKRTAIGQTVVGSIYAEMNFDARTCFPVFRGFGVSYNNHAPTCISTKYLGKGKAGVTRTSNLIVVALTDNATVLNGSADLGNCFGGNNTIKTITGRFNVQNGGLFFYQGGVCPKLETFYMEGLKNNINLSGMPSLTAATVAYIITKAGTANITITLHATAYTRAMADSSVTSALATKTNVTLASAT